MANSVLKRGFLSTPSARRATTALAFVLLRVKYFYPRPPRGGRHVLGADRDSRAGFLSTPSARRATHAHPQGSGSRRFLSTPSARRATTCPRPTPTGCRNFYPRPPRGGRLYHISNTAVDNNFYPRPPRGGRPSFLVSAAVCFGISIHALREEGDLPTISL